MANNNTARTNNFIQQLNIQQLNLSLISLCQSHNEEERHSIDYKIQVKATGILKHGGDLEKISRKLADSQECLEYAQNSKKKSDWEDIPFFQGRVSKLQQQVRELDQKTRQVKQEYAEAKAELEANRNYSHQLTRALWVTSEEVEI
ncbi:hypothetical protein [Moorena sp. SIO3A2]|uniref:hypothetical protein n=1 Tax=Moorena sp. SIO3A2 TaxID=2607841 RepID=UPI0013B81D63|nr:hypothetical protein [Moorena sp. SIO3A2]NER90384.1 hypothetical protein [Moorena sp. SIO3A2]